MDGCSLLDRPACSLRMLLRSETRAVHEALHDLPDFARLARGEITRPDYGRLLLRLHGFYAALDPVLGAACRRFARDTDGAFHAPRAPVLAQDLEALGLRPGLRTGRGLPNLDGAAATAGALYVVDGALIGGASLGGAARSLPWPAPAGFWEWCWRERPVLWPRTVRLLDRIDSGPTERIAALEAATSVFQSFGASVADPAAPGPG